MTFILALPKRIDRKQSKHNVYINFFILGRYTKSIDNYRLTVPHRLNKDGEFMSFNIPQYFNNFPQQERRKRSGSDEGMAHYGVTIKGRDYHIELRPNYDFLSPNLVFESRDPNSKVQDKKFRTLEDRHACHYTGHVRDEVNSRAALSTCNGLVMYEYLSEFIKFEGTLEQSLFDSIQLPVLVKTVIRMLLAHFLLTYFNRTRGLHSLDHRQLHSTFISICKIGFCILNDFKNVKINYRFSLFNIRRLLATAKICQ